MLKKYLNTAAAIKEGSEVARTAYWLGTLDGIIVVAIIAAIVWGVMT